MAILKTARVRTERGTRLVSTAVYLYIWPITIEGGINAVAQSWKTSFCAKVTVVPS